MEYRKPDENKQTLLAVLMISFYSILLCYLIGWCILDNKKKEPEYYDEDPYEQQNLLNISEELDRELERRARSKEPSYDEETL